PYCLETHLHWFLGSLFVLSQFEVLSLLESKSVADQVAGEGLESDAQVAHVAVIEAAGGLDLVLGVSQFPLQVDEVGAGLEVRIILRYRQEAAERLGKGAFSGSHGR